MAIGSSTDPLVQALLQRTLSGQIDKAPSLVSPQIAAFTPSAAESSLFAQASTNPYALAHAVGARGRRMSDSTDYLSALNENNLMRIATAKTAQGNELAAGVLAEIIKNPDFVEKLGPLAFDLTKPHGVSPSDPALAEGALAQLAARANATAVKDAGAGVDSARQGGQEFNVDPLLNALGLSNAQPTTPTSVQAAQVDANTPKITFTTPSGLGVTQPITPEQANQLQQERLGNVTQDGRQMYATPAAQRAVEDYMTRGRDRNITGTPLGVDQEGNTQLHMRTPNGRSYLYVFDRNGKLISNTEVTGGGQPQQ